MQSYKFKLREKKDILKIESWVRNFFKTDAQAACNGLMTSAYKQFRLQCLRVLKNGFSEIQAQTSTFNTYLGDNVTLSYKAGFVMISVRSIIVENAVVNQHDEHLLKRKRSTN